MTSRILRYLAFVLDEIEERYTDSFLPTEAEGEMTELEREVVIPRVENLDESELSSVDELIDELEDLETEGVER